MRYIFCIILILTIMPFAIYARVDVVSYRNHINLAELALIQNDYKAAHYQYNKATENFNKISALNLHNALHTSISLGNIKAAKQYAWKLSNLGINSLYFTNSITLAKCLAKEKKWWERLLNNCRKRSDNQRLENAAYRKRFNQLLDMHRELISNKTRKNFKESPLLTVQYAHLINSFTSFINDNGFPTEQILGIETKNDTLINEHKAIYDILSSYYKGLIYNKALDEICLSAVKCGELDNYDFAQLNDQNPNFSGRIYGTSNYFFIYNCSVYEDKPAIVEFTKPIDVKERIDSFRKLIHLEKLDNSYLKMTYSLTNNNDKFLIRDQFTLIYPFSDNELQATFLANKRFLTILKDCK